MKSDHNKFVPEIEMPGKLDTEPDEIRD